MSAPAARSAHPEPQCAGCPVTSRRPPIRPGRTPSGRPRCWRWTRTLWAASRCAPRPARCATTGPALLRALLDDAQPWRRMPSHIGDERLLGGLDLTATLQAGRPVAQRGLLAECDGGLLLLPMAERLSAATAARLAQVLDSGEIGAEREGIAQRWPCRIGIVAFDEGRDDDPALPGALADRLAFHCDLSALGWGHVGDATHGAADIQAARARLPQVALAEPIAQALCATALRMGVPSLRASLMALRAARASAALHGRSEVTEDDARLAARLVLAPRATIAPPPPEATPDEPPAARAAAARAGPRQRRRDPGARRPADRGHAGGAAGRAAGGLAQRRGGAQRRPRRCAVALAARRPAGGFARRHAARRGAAEPDRHAARRGAVAAAARRRSAGRAAARAGARQRPAHRAAAAARGHGHAVRHRCLGLVGAAPAGRGQGRRQPAAGRVLCAPRPGGRDRLPRPQGRAAAAADTLAGACQAQPGRSAGRRRHAAGCRAAGRRADGRPGATRGCRAGAGAADRWPRQHRARRRARARARRGRCAADGAAAARRGLQRAGGGHLAAAVGRGAGAGAGAWRRPTARCRMPARPSCRPRCARCRAPRTDAGLGARRPRLAAPRAQPLRGQRRPALARAAVAGAVGAGTATAAAARHRRVHAFVAPSGAAPRAACRRGGARPARPWLQRCGARRRRHAARHGARRGRAAARDRRGSLRC